MIHSKKLLQNLLRRIGKAKAMKKEKVRHFGFLCFVMSMAWNILNNLLIFEEQVHLDHTSFIDGTIPSTKVLIEQKGFEKDLKKPIKQSDGTLLTPFQQAKRYITELPLSQHPRWVVTCNFENSLFTIWNVPVASQKKFYWKILRKNITACNFWLMRAANI